jgi:hypothetical protein
MRTISAVAAWNGEEFRCAGAILAELSGANTQEADHANLRTMVVLQDVDGPKETSESQSGAAVLYPIKHRLTTHPVVT